MLLRFRGFELDEDGRELRLNGSAVPLQPRVFALLVFLAANRERVVAKDELLEGVWPGTFVADNALQRAISLARRALRAGGAEDVIRTYPRHGYRFICDAAEETTPLPAAAAPGPLDAARAAARANQWKEASAAFAAAAAAGPLTSPADIEAWAVATQYVGRPGDGDGLLEQALEAYLAAGDLCGAARMAILLGHSAVEVRKLALARAWHARADRLLANLDEEVPEHGHLAALAARTALLNGDFALAVAEGARAQDIGRRLRNPTAEALGLDYEGLARQSLGEMEAGAVLQDEAAAIVVSGGVEPWAGGLVYCGILWACRNRGEWDRAAQWTETFTRWCGQRGIDSFTGSCRLHRADVLSVQGKVAEAEQEIRAALGDIPPRAGWGTGELNHVLGDLHLAVGELDKAAAAYAQAHEVGWDPQPGHAILLATRGHLDDALHSLERALDDTSWVHRQRRGQLLSHYAAIAAQCGHADQAAAALAELDARPGMAAAPAVRACAEKARAELLLLDGRRRDAVAALRRSVALCRDAGAPLHLIHVRIRLAEVLRLHGDAGGARRELASAEASAADMGLAKILERCAALRLSWDRVARAGAAADGPAPTDQPTSR